MTIDLTGKNVLITGANRGIGHGLAEGFLKAGAEVTIVALEEDVVEVAGHLTECHGRTVGAVQCDIADLEQVARLAHKNNAIENFNTQFEHKDGSKFWSSVNARCIKNENGDFPKCYI